MMPNRVQIDGCDMDAGIVARRPHLLVRVADVVHKVAWQRPDSARAGVGAGGGVSSEWAMVAAVGISADGAIGAAVGISADGAIGAAGGVGAGAAIGAEFELSIDGMIYRGWRCAIGNDVHIRLHGRTFIAHFDKGGSTTDKESSQQEIRADMPGVVVAVHCEPGREVKTGDKLLTTESMKLQATLVASRDALVDQIHVAPATVFERGALLVSFARRGAGST